MARSAVLALVPLLVACAASRPCVPVESRVLSRSQGIPKPIFAGSEALLTKDENRICQVLFEPAFAAPNAVWLTVSPSGNVVVSVTVLTKVFHVERYTAELDGDTVSRLNGLCADFLSRSPEVCDHIGYDGVWYHAAHYVEGRGYLMRSFWHPHTDGVDHRFVELAEALRDYTVSPAFLRAERWVRIQDTSGALRDALTTSNPAHRVRSAP
jgi:hypothetical protein